MTLDEYLRHREMKPSAFAAEIGLPPSTITRLLNREREPRLGLIQKIKERTGGLVTAEDWARHWQDAEGERA